MIYCAEENEFYKCFEQSVFGEYIALSLLEAVSVFLFAFGCIPSIIPNKKILFVQIKWSLLYFRFFFPDPFAEM